jgi:hypothetical protein
LGWNFKLFKKTSQIVKKVELYFYIYEIIVKNIGRPWNNRKHINIISPKYLKNYFEDNNFRKVFISGVDLNNRLYGYGEKNEESINSSTI